MTIPGGTVQVDGLRTAVDEALAGDRWGVATELLKRLWWDHAGPSQAGFVLARAARLPPTHVRASARMAILRSFTIEPLVPVLRAAAILGGIDLSVVAGGFGTYAQEILDPGSDLYGAWEPTIVVLAVQTRDIVPDLWDGVGADEVVDNAGIADRVSRQVVSLIETFRSRSGASLIVHGFESPPLPRLGIADRRHADGQIAAVHRVNAAIAACCDGVDGVQFLDYDAVAAECGKAVFFDEAKWAAMRAPIPAGQLAAVAAELLRRVHPLVGRTAKAVAVDLDDTLWGGVVGEEGVDGISLGPEGPGRHFVAVQRALLALRERGVLLAICSKNNPVDALAALDSHPHMLLRSKHFDAVQVNWIDKPTNLRKIAHQLNIGLDAIAFVDDNPAERAVVAETVPEVVVIEIGDDPARFAEALLRSPFFERHSLSDEDRNRATYYARDRARAELQDSAASLEEFLTSLGTTLTMSPAGPDEVQRLSQLTLKTNQLNVTTRRYTPQALGERLAAGSSHVYAARAADRFGDHGLVGVAIAEADGDEWRLDTLLLSCRVIGRDIEVAMLHIVAADAAAAGATDLIAEFVPTAKNAPAADLFERAGFRPLERPEAQTDGTLYTWDLAEGPLASPAWVTIKLPGPDEEQSDG